MPLRIHSLPSGFLRSRALVSTLLLLVAGVSTPTASGQGIVATWRGLAVGELTAALSPLIGRPLVLDARVDPTTPITLVADGLTPEQLLNDLAEQTGAEVVVLRESVRLGPAGRRASLQAAEEQRTEELRSAPGDLRRSLAKREPPTWTAAATPRDLLKETAIAAGTTITGLEQVPHDHLRQTILPEITTAAALDLLLASYDLRSAITPEGLKVVPLDPQAQPRKPPQLPALASAQRDRMPENASTRFTLEAAAPLDQLLTAIAMQTGLTLQLDTAAFKDAGIDPATIVRVAVKDASLPKLLDAVTTPLGIQWTVTGKVLGVTASSPPSGREPAGDEPPRD